MRNIIGKMKITGGNNDNMDKFVKMLENQLLSQGAGVCACNWTFAGPICYALDKMEW